MRSVLLIILILLPILIVNGCDEIVIETRIGKFRGITDTSILGFKFCSFKGIPYAEAPVGDLRFQDPSPALKSTDIRDAKDYSAVCSQSNIITWRFEGSEDCLYLNVHVQSIDSNISRPVMVYFHGGAFFFGSADDFRPDYFMQKNIVFVSVNYRLGVFGFLNLKDSIAPGNQGLKDQVMALQWIKDNIANFGGDPDSVTIFGESAGGVSVHYLTLSPLAKGLFNKAIIQSGVIQNSWARELTDPRKVVYEMCSRLGFKSQDHHEIIEFLKKVDCITLINAQKTFLRSWADPKLYFPFGPSIDSESKNPILPVDPLLAAKDGVQVPLIIGNTNKEGILCFFSNPSYVKQNLKNINDDFANSLSVVAINYFKEKYNVSVSKLKKMYIGEESFSHNNREKLMDLLGDIYFNEGTHSAVRIQVLKGSMPTFFYRFDFDKGFSIVKTISNSLQINGAAHSDELFILFRYRSVEKMLKYSLHQSPEELRLMEQMIEMWVNFATVSDPTPDKTSLLPVQWQPVRDINEFQIMSFDTELKMTRVQNLENVFVKT